MQTREWQLAAHPIFLAQVRRLAARQHGASAPAQRARVQVLAMLSALCLRIVPADPMHPAFEFDNLEQRFSGRWRRAHFGARRFMLLFRADPDARIIIFGRIADLEASDMGMDAQTAVVMGDICPITSTGKICLPFAVRESLRVGAGGRVSLNVHGLRDPVMIEPAEVDMCALSELAFRLRSPGTPPDDAHARQASNAGHARPEALSVTPNSGTDAAGQPPAVTSPPQAPQAVHPEH